MHDLIKECFSADITIIGRTVPQFGNILLRNPFRNADPAKLYFTLLAAKPENRLISEFLAPGYSPDQVEIIGDWCACSAPPDKAT